LPKLHAHRDISEMTIPMPLSCGSSLPNISNTELDIHDLAKSTQCIFAPPMQAGAVLSSAAA
jgi:hypothetical protein